MTWVLGGSLAIYTCGSISGGHLNPAVSLAFALVRPAVFPVTHFIPYLIAQVIGAFGAAAANYYIYFKAIEAFEAENEFVRNESGFSFGGAFGCYWSGFVSSPTHALAMGSIIAIIGSLSGGAINPARDVGPRLFTYLFGGWDDYALSGAWVYSAGPFIGGPLGAVIADGIVRNPA